LPKTEQKRNLLRHFSKITGKPQPSVNNIMTGNDKRLPVQPRYDMPNSPTEEFTESESAHFLAHTQNCEKKLLASSCLSICLHKWNNWIDFNENLYLNIYLKSIKNSQVSLKFKKENRYFT
jgi:hypothetical protein